MKISELKYAKIRDVGSPVRANGGDAGLDIFVPMNLVSNEKLESHFIIEPQKRVLIPSGLKFNVPFGYALIAFNKSGVASKKGLDLLACVIDHGYQGEVVVNVVNTGDESVELGPGDKMTQLLLIPIELPVPVEVSLEHLYDEVSDRGEGGFGSTDNKS